MSPIDVRPAASHDMASLLKMPPYSRGGLTFPFKEEILVAEDNGTVVGAVSVCDKEISLVHGEWNEEFERCLNKFEKVTSRMISKLYVLPTYRYGGIGTKLVGEAVRHANEKGFNEVYAGIYTRNDFKDISQHIFEKNGFAKIGSCICFLSEGYCRGTLLKRTTSLNNFEKSKSKKKERAHIPLNISNTRNWHELRQLAHVPKVHLPAEHASHHLGQHHSVALFSSFFLSDQNYILVGCLCRDS